MTREKKLDMAMAAAMLGLQQPGTIPGAFALALVMHTLAPWSEPAGRDLERAHATAARFKLHEDLAIFMPPEPGRFSGRARKDAYRGLVISLKQLDALEGDARARAIAEVRVLLGAG